MLACFTTAPENPRPLHVVRESAAERWLETAPERWRAWLDGINYKPRPAAGALLPAADGTPEAALLVVGEPASPYDVAAAYGRLPDGDWTIESPDLDLGVAALGWALAAYRFDRYRKLEPVRRRLVVEDGQVLARANTIAHSVFLARDLINTPANDLGPEELAAAVHEVGETHGAEVASLAGDELLEHGYPAVHAVGRAS
ncbi:MAG: leucyl aminopeptidase family protein, partial [Geminicoccaceae bacterium]|nr:leucyl aminopeptidase family protein [Geminicoccaceae bacterium]